MATKISHCVAWLASCLTTNLIVRIPQSFGVDRLARIPLQELVGKAENLKTAGITNDPEIQLESLRRRNLDETRQTRLLFDGSIDAG